MTTRAPTLALALATACFEYSPHALVLESSERDLHRKAVARLEAAPVPATLRFAVVGDTQIAFDQAEKAIAHVGARDDIAFVVQMGDFTHVGLAPEFRLMNDLFARLPVPYFVVIGIHDYLGNGEDMYERMFGPPNFAFTVGRTRFVLFDSNSREFGFDGRVPDVAWLGAQLAPDGAHDLTVLFSHVAPGHGDFDHSLLPAYDALLRESGPVVSFHAHEHEFRSEEREGTPLWVADSIDHHSYLVATLQPDGALEVERVWF